jgi:hypothetical protein
MRHQKLHLIGQDAAVAQNEVFPQAGHIRRVKQRHMRLLGRAGGFAVVAAFAGGDDIHPAIHAALGVGDDVFAREVFFVEMVAAIGADVAVAHEEFAVGQARAQIEGVDIGHAFGANDGRDMNDALLARDGVVPTAKCGHALAHFPAHLFGGIVDDRLLQADPTLWQPLGR